MCTTCGCGAGNVSIEESNAHENVHSHQHQHDKSHGAETVVVHHHHYYGPVTIHYHIQNSESVPHSHPHEHSHEQFPTENEHVHKEVAPESLEAPKEPKVPVAEPENAHADVTENTQSRMVRVEQDILAKNNAIAEQNRNFLNQNRITTLNLMSSPGSGKTTLLIATLNYLDPKKCFVIEGDQQTTNDAERIRTTGAKAIQVNTGKGCHLDAEMVAKAISRLMPEKESVLFIENVGNLVCPAPFDLGEKYKIVILSVTEGEDKPLKYPDIFANADLLIINKADLLPYLEFDLEACVINARRINPKIECIVLSAVTGEGVQSWLEWLGNC